MWISDISVQRPVLAVMLSAALVALGLLQSSHKPPAVSLLAGMKRAALPEDAFPWFSLNAFLAFSKAPSQFGGCLPSFFSNKALNLVQ